MVATKDLIMLTIFMISLVVLFQTTNHVMALTTTMFIVIIYLIKDIRLKNSLKRELKNQIDIFIMLIEIILSKLLLWDFNLMKTYYNKI